MARNEQSSKDVVGQANATGGEGAHVGKNDSAIGKHGTDGQGPKQYTLAHTYTVIQPLTYLLVSVVCLGYRPHCNIFAKKLDLLVRTGSLWERNGKVLPLFGFGLRCCFPSPVRPTFPSLKSTSRLFRTHGRTGCVQS